MKYLLTIALLIGLSGCLQTDPQYQALELAVGRCDDMIMWGAHAGDDLGAKCIQAKIALIDYLLEQAKK